MPINLFGKFAALVLAIAAVVGIARLTAIRWWKVPLDDPELTTSLAPSLSPGDWVLLWRATTPGVGALVLCPDPEDGSELVVGRIATLGGDRVEIGDRGALDVSRQKIRTDQSCRESTFVVEHPTKGSEVTMQCDVEVLGGIHHLRGTERNARIPVADVDEQVEPGRLFLVSDNRQYPFDSRDYGSLDPRTCRERVFFRLVGGAGFENVESRLSWID